MSKTAYFVFSVMAVVLLTVQLATMDWPALDRIIYALLPG